MKKTLQDNIEDNEMLNVEYLAFLYIMYVYVYVYMWLVINV